MEVFLKCNEEWKKQVTDLYIQCGNIYVRCKNKQIKTICQLQWHTCEHRNSGEW